MSDIERKLLEIEAKATESQLIADLATDDEARIYNTRLAEELREYAGTLRKRLVTAEAHDA